jgi:hypothetical protein
LKQIEFKRSKRRPKRELVYGSRTLSEEREPNAEKGEELDLGPTHVPQPSATGLGLPTGIRDLRTVIGYTTHGHRVPTD